MICENIGLAANGELTFAGQSTSALAERYGTPVYLLDEDRIRQRCRTYMTAMRSVFGERFRVLYSSKAASFKRIYDIMREEGLGVDVVSRGEIHTAFKAGFPLEKAFFHSNNKTDEDIAFAMDHGVGFFIVDNTEELYAIESEAKKRGTEQKILLRLTPGIDPHTYAAVCTGQVDSKFGSAIETGQAEEITKKALSLPHIELMGYHCHVGSQVFDSDVFFKASSVMLSFAADMKERCGFSARIINLGGGYGVRYVEDQPTIDIAENVKQVGAYIRNRADELGMEVPEICLEPGRSIVADAGMTLYTVGTVKRIPGYKNYVSVDGGMTDNVRFAMYGAPYTILPVSDPMIGGEKMTADVVGRCCESGDILQKNVTLPADIGRGDLLACLTTGAYHYSMASNYNRIPRPPVVMLSGGESYIAVRRETEEDIVSLDV